MKRLFTGIILLAHDAHVRISAFSLLFLWALASLLVHSVPHGETVHTSILEGAQIPSTVADTIARACTNCHSENTQWPWYSNIAPASWLIENDVAHAREHLNLSRWQSLDNAEQRILLTAIGTVIENHEMPPRQYLMLHSEAQLSADEALEIIEWTRAERRRLRTTSNRSATTNLTTGHLVAK
jgi:hypothetical protein